jgi:hypothetical protein
MRTRSTQNPNGLVRQPDQDATRLRVFYKFAVCAKGPWPFKRVLYFPFSSDAPISLRAFDYWNCAVTVVVPESIPMVSTTVTGLVSPVKSAPVPSAMKVNMLLPSGTI